RDGAVAVIGGISIAERGSEIDALGRDILLIAILPVEVDDVFDGPKIARFVVISDCIFDVVEAELVLAGGCNGCAGVSAAALEPLVTVAVGVFFATECLDAGRVEALDQFFEEYRFDVLVSDELGECSERYGFVVVDTEFEPHVDFSVHGVASVWSPEATPS